jgi:hypothetical protein
MKVNTECREILPWEKSGLTVTFITDVHLVPRLRLELRFHFPICLYVMNRDKFTFTFNLTDINREIKSVQKYVT